MSEEILTKEDLEVLDENILNISLSGKLSIDWCSAQFSIDMQVDPLIGYDKTYKFARGQVYYRLQQLRKDLENKFKYTDGGQVPQHRT